MIFFVLCPFLCFKFLYFLSTFLSTYNRLLYYTLEDCLLYRQHLKSVQLGTIRVHVVGICWRYKATTVISVQLFACLFVPDEKLAAILYVRGESLSWQSFMWVMKCDKRERFGRSSLSTWKYQFSYDHWSQATLGSVSTSMGDCSSVAWVLLLTHKVG